MADNLYETLKKTALAHVEAFNSPSHFDTAAAEATRTPDCLQYLRPVRSLAPPWDTPMALPHLAQALALLRPVMSRAHFEVQDVVVDTRSRTVVVRLEATYDFRAFGDEPEELGWRTEYMWLTEMEETGTKICRMEEMLDTARMFGYAVPKALRYAAFCESGGKAEQV